MPNLPNPSFVDPALEPDVRRLYSSACCGGEAILHAAEHPRDVFQDPVKRAAFFKAAHAGFAAAQNEVIERLLSMERDGTTSKWKRTTEYVLRKVMDAVAWQILSEQLYVARRLYRGHKPPTLSQSNIESLVKVAAIVREKKETAFALISDATSFVQIGDLIVFDPDEGLKFVEVKEGAKNKAILDFAEFFAESRCERALYYFAREHGVKSVDQLGRVFRQGQRMGHVSSVISKGTGIDPDTKQKIVIPEEPLNIESYDDDLYALLKQVESKSWAIDVVDDCLFVGAYSGMMIRMGWIAFQAWFARSDGRKGCPMINQLQSMTNALALPIFSRKIGVEQKFDLLFGRSSLLLALDLDKFIEVARAQGVELRWATRKEAGRLQRGHSLKGAISIGDQIMMAENGEAKMVVYGGIIERILLHGTTPHSAINIIKRSLELDPAQGLDEGGG